jgi:hypothetical protein
MLDPQAGAAIYAVGFAAPPPCGVLGFITPLGGQAFVDDLSTH